MAINRNHIVTGQSLELFDKVFDEMSTQLLTNLKWLNQAYGRAERTVKTVNGKRIYTPCVFHHDNDYTELTPDSGIGNFSFFWVDDPQDVRMDHYSVELKTPFSAVFWFDYRKIYNGVNRNRDQVKADILDVFKNMVLKHGGFTINRAYDLAENIYRGFSLDEVDNQFLMAPYGGVRFEGEVWVTKNCTNVTTTTTL